MNNERYLENLYPELDLQDFKPYPGQKDVMRLVKLRPEHALMLQKAFQAGTDHIAGFFKWAEGAQNWDTKRVLTWIQDNLKAEWPFEDYLFLLGKNVAGMGSILPMKNIRHVQIGYWVSNKYLKQGVGETIARTLERLCFESRAYEKVFINHDSSNRASRRIPQALGYEFVGTFNEAPQTSQESGLWYSWMKINPRYEDCVNERLKNLRYVQLFCALIQKMHPETYLDQYTVIHRQANEEFRKELENVRSMEISVEVV